MKLYKKIPALTAAAVIGSVFVCIPVNAADAEDYSYEVYPILEGFNQFYFVKTDNPDPTSFRFLDVNTVYDESGTTTITRTSTAYADIIYENADTLRVDGGYLFYNAYNDGGEFRLQTQKRVLNGYYYKTEWVDTDIVCTVPAAVDTTDYLINKYAKGGDLFDDLSAVQSGLSSICLYSGSSIRGDLVHLENIYWGLSAYNHVDQSFYIYSPYSRKSGEYLFASSLYPYRYDSLSFPSKIGAVARKLEPSATVVKNSSAHYLVDVTYNGVTKSYEGQGNGDGKLIGKSDIKHYFHFGSQNDIRTLEESKALLVEYLKTEVGDDVPREDELTWKQVNDTVGEGSWVKPYWYGGKDVYSYLYKLNDNDYYFSSSFDPGHSNYYSGSLGYASNAWVDGRYVNNDEIYVPGEKLEDHTDAKVILYSVPVPTLSYKRTSKYNYELGKYEYTYSDINVTYTSKRTTLSYDAASGIWSAPIENKSYWDMFIEQGLISESYLDSVRFTTDELKAMGVDENTDIAPDHGYNFDRTVQPGTPFGTFPERSARAKNGFLLIKKAGGTQVIRLSAVNSEMLDSLGEDRQLITDYVNAFSASEDGSCFAMTEAQMTAVKAVLGKE